MTRILAFSDIHRDLDACARLVEAGTQADLVIGAGDFASIHRGLEETMQALAPLAPKAVYVPGNNETEEALRAATPALVLHGQGVTFAGLRLVGLGAAVPPLPPLPWGSFDLTEDQAEAALAPFDACDVLILHAPPRGVADVITGRGSMGSTALRDAIGRLRPKLALCGHIHDGWGQSGMIGTTTVHNLGPGVTWFDI